MSPLYETARDRTRDRKARKQTGSEYARLCATINEALEPAIHRCIAALNRQEIDPLGFINDMNQLHRAMNSFVSAENRFFIACSQVSEQRDWPRHALEEVDAVLADD